ncbi:MAG: hypothetical protein JSS50_03935 [Proteobacteria bacterium]|nr:hypothetical protein [Pseudomonadota bacterium]
MSKFDDMIKIADRHADRIEMALLWLRYLFPIDARKVKDLTDQEFSFIEVLINRFAKLQDYLGAKVFDEFLRLVDDYSEDATTLDKLNKLERLKIIENVDLWRQMREVRNHIAHEYPDDPALTAKYLNQIYILAPKLLGILETLKRKALPLVIM